DEGKKWKIGSSLGRLGAPGGEKIARDNYRRQLDHKDDAVKGNAALALANMRDRSVVPKLKKLAKSLPADMARLHVLQALTRLGHREGVGPLLAEIIANRKANEFARIGAVDFAPKIRAVECIPAMNDSIINDEGHFTMRYRTAWALVALGDPAAIPALIHKKIMKGPHAYGGWVVMEGLGQFKDKRVVNALIEFLEDKNDWPRMRALAAQSLGRIGDELAVPTLINELRDLQQRNHTGVVRVSAARALAAIGAKVAIEPLMEAARNERDLPVRRAAVQALVTMRVPEATGFVLKALGDSSARARRRAAASASGITGIDYKHFIAAARAYPNNTGRIDTLRKMCETARKAAPEIEGLKKTIADNPKNLDAYLELGALYEDLSMSGRALSIYRKYVNAAGDAAKPEILRLLDKPPAGAMGEQGPWWFLGPFDYKGFDADYPPELAVVMQSYPGKGGVEIMWQPVELIASDLGSVSAEFGNYTRLPYKSAVFFVYRNLYSSAERRLQLRLGSDDGLKVWFNGREVISHNVHRGSALDQDTAEVTFRKGINRLLIRVHNDYSHCAFFFRITDSAGKPVMFDKQGSLL
ncbi:MAG: HEAT repeat domain-containing protein, partial [Planctomycetia bacterium]|nr:HEAT repeat domain-containing protein [Planctomycetia bacterium]